MEYEIEGGVTAPKGFKTAGVNAGIKFNKKDMCIIFSEKPAETAGVFTQNKIAAAPVVINKHQLAQNQKISAIVVNSGIANACTGEKGLKDACETIEYTSKVLRIGQETVLVSSTGVIGKNLFMEKIKKGINLCASGLSSANHLDAAKAIMTTDTFPKEFALRGKIGDEEFTIGGMAKGSGMIKPDMATMLAFITTDISIEQSLLKKALISAVNKSFNRISVDNDTSTNDMVILMANGFSNIPTIKSGSAEFDIFYDLLEKVCITLAKMIVKDGEGATKLIEIKVKGAASEDVALKAARSVADSYLVKTAIHGEDANWGRIIAAIGYSGIEFEPEKVKLKINDLQIINQNFEQVFSEKEAKRALSQREIKIEVDLSQGTYDSNIWTCDLSKDYVSINANYRS